MTDERGKRGLNILCIDGGGVRGLSSLLLISEAMNRMQQLEKLDSPPAPCQYFDIIAGTGTGALAACMLGGLELPIQQAIKCYGNLVKNVFSDRKWIGSSASAFKSSKLKDEIKAIIKEATGSEHEPMVRKSSKAHDCKTIIFAMSQHHLNTGKPTAFRSYQGFVNQAPECAMWEAICASMAHPGLFKSVAISAPPLQESFIDGGLACNNPLAHALAEVKTAYPDGHVASIISIGAGHAHTIQIPDASWLHRFFPTRVITAMKEIATDSERVAQEMLSRFNGTTGMYFRFNVDQGTQSVGLSEWERLSEVAAHTRAYTGRDEISQMMNSAIRAIKNRKPVLTTAQLDGQVQIGSVGLEPGIMKHCPAPTPAFTGRTSHIEKVESCIITEDNDRRVCIVHGLGGAGKTQLVLKAIERTQERWAAVLYVDASSREAIESTLQGFAIANNLGETHEDTLRWLESCKRWLLVFDNADTPSLDIHQFFPGANHGSIIITTRLHDMVMLAKGPNSDCRVSSMAPQEAEALLMKMARVQDAILPSNDVTAAAALLEDFGYLALAIVHAGVYIGHSSISLSEYRERFLARRRATLEEYSKMPVKVDDYRWTVYTTWKFCFESLGSNAQEMFRLIAFLHYDGITEDIFRLAAINMQSYEPQVPLTDMETTALVSIRQFLNTFLNSEGHWDSHAFLTTINEISTYSLLERDRTNRSYRIHVLVQDWARTLTQQTPDLALECTRTLLSLSIDDDNSAEARNFRRTLELHVNTVLGWQLPISANYGASFATVYSERGQWQKSEELQTKVLEAGRRLLGDKNPFTLTAKANLAMTFWKQGRWGEAEALEVEVVVERTRILGEEDPNTLVAKANLAATLRKQGRWDEAEKLQLEVVNSRSRTLGDTHLDVLTAKSNLAATLQKQGRWDEAERLQADVVNVRKQVLGEEHPHTLDAKGNLAATYRKQGRWHETEHLEVEVLDAMERVLGREHPHTLIAKANLAATYRKQGQWDKVEELEVEVVAAMKRVLYKEHPHLLNAKSNLAATYRKQGRWDEAEKLQMEVVDAMKQVLGDKHLHTLDAKSNLAATFRKQGRWAEAEILQVEVVDAMNEALGNKHPDTLTAKANLSSTFQKQGRWNEAEKLQVEVMDAREHAFGGRHPDTLSAKSNLAITFWNQGRWDEARKLQVEVVDLSKQVLGINHPHTLQYEKTLQRIGSKMISS